MVVCWWPLRSILRRIGTLSVQGRMLVAMGHTSACGTGLGSVSAPTGHGQCWAGGMATHADTRGEYANDRRGRQYSSSQSGIHSGQSQVLGCEWVAAEYSATDGLVFTGSIVLELGLHSSLIIWA